MSSGVDDLLAVVNEARSNRRTRLKVNFVLDAAASHLMLKLHNSSL